ncbi:hypothetical protein DFH07DRAFT_945475 [Mycena maculata]|uniref:Uncharacterized protein n=1 Tax=Mycena maculata TaxID=230809 RepID=A0AAD7MRM1_9AGAR|nr:hypothetical protein DFH07DRAFT_945475 [Mycena maculata]
MNHQPSSLGYWFELDFNLISVYPDHNFINHPFVLFLTSTKIPTVGESDVPLDLVICRAKRGKRDLRDLWTSTQVRSVRKKTGGSPVGCSRNTTARKGTGRGAEYSGGSWWKRTNSVGAQHKCNRLCGSGTHPGRDPSDRKRSGRRAWEPGLICDSAGDLEDARKGTKEAPDEVKGIWLRMQMNGGKNNKDKQDPEVPGRLRNEDEIEGRLSP